MKHKSIMLLAALGAIGATTLTACGNGPAEGGDSLIQIRCYNGGYGHDWLDKLIEAYVKVFPNHKVKIEEASTGVTEKAPLEIQTPKKNNIDLYFTTNGNLTTLIGNSKNILRTDKKVLLEDLTDILDSKAIGADGKEESETIRSRIFNGYVDASSYHGMVSKWEGKVYKLPWADGVTGVFYNPALLEQFKIDVPLTSNEFVAAIKKIASAVTNPKIYPYSWAGNNAPGYWSYLYETWHAQYKGAENFRQFMRCDSGDGDIKKNGYKVYEDISIQKALEPMFELLDFDYSPEGSAEMPHMDAQTDFIDGKSVFMCDGDWVHNEMKKTSLEKISKIKFLKTPILSSLGEDNGLTDTELHDLVQAIDDRKDNSEIKLLVPSATDDIIAKIKEARCVHDCLGFTHDIVIPEYADAKAAAKNFVRFMYSNDGCRIFRNNAYANLPLRYKTEASDVKTPFLESIDAVYNYDKVEMVSAEASLNDVRAKSSMRVFNVPTWSHPNTFTTIMLDKSQQKKLSAEYIFTKEKEYMTNNWSTYMQFVYGS